MDARPPRRRFLQLAGTGAVASVAGCSALDQDGTDPEDDDGGDDTRQAAAEFVVTAAVDIDEAELEEAQAEIQQAVEDGELDQQEAQVRAQETQAELIADAVEAFEQHVADTESLTVRETAEQAGVALIEGHAKALIEVLTADEVVGILAEEEFEALQPPQPGEQEP